MRTKQDYVLEADERGKQKPVKIGMNPIQRDGFEYEFDVVPRWILKIKALSKDPLRRFSGWRVQEAANKSPTF